MSVAKPKRHFLPQDFTVRNWEELKPFFETLTNAIFQSETDFEQWLLNLSELESVVSEDLAWRYIRTTCDTTNKELESAYLDFVTNIQPHIAPYEDLLNKKIASSPYASTLEKSSDYFIYFRGVKKAIEIFREENIPIYTELQSLAQQYGSINGLMTVTHDGKELTLQQASNFLKETDRELRKEIYEKIGSRRLQDKDQLNNLFTELIQRRHKVAVNAGFANFRDYMFASMGRFDYSVQDCYNFHQAIAQEVVPLNRKLQLERQEKLQLDKLKPYDLAVDPSGNKPLKPFSDGQELLEKSIECFNRLDHYFGACLTTMKTMGQLDLDSRIGKAPGGYNYPLAETGVPFIFMNAAGSLRDVETMVHEGGHAIHSFLTKDLPLNAFKNCPSEVAELASMSMELLSMDAWDVFFSDENELLRAKKEQLEGVIQTLPWIATIDKFQHWIYENPFHSLNERESKWIEISNEFDTGLVDTTGYEMFQAFSWQKQLHLYEVPFYYIEYGFAQLGAVGVWKNYCQNKEKSLTQYKEALALGYTKTIPEIYETAGVRFDFSAEYIQSLFSFVWQQLEKIKNR